LPATRFPQARICSLVELGHTASSNDYSNMLESEP
jgi:hypothetical protein